MPHLHVPNGSTTVHTQPPPARRGLSCLVKLCDNGGMPVPRIPRDPEQWNRFVNEHDGPIAWTVRAAPWLVGAFLLACLVLAIMVACDG